MKYKLIASDYDDTLLPPSMKVSEYTHAVIKRYIDQGGIFVLCTGRMYRSIRKEAEKLNLHGDAIAYQGALTKNLDSGKVLDNVAIDPDLAVEYIDFMQSKGCAVQMYADDNLLVADANPYSLYYSQFCGVKLNIVGDLSEFISRRGKIVNKVYCHVPAETCARIRNEANNMFGDRLLINSSKPTNVEAVDISTSKGTALTKLVASYGLDMSEVMTFGDNLNDMSLVECAGFGVAVGNAVGELKAAAKYVSESVGDDGVAKTIERFCLGD